MSNASVMEVATPEVVTETETKAVKTKPAQAAKQDVKTEKKAGVLSLAYAVVSYFAFFGTFSGFALWAGGLLPFATPFESLGLSTGGAIAFNFALITIFAIQHTVMARKGFKKWWTRFVPEHIERSTFLLFAAVPLAAVVLFWQPLNAEVWSVTNTAGSAMLWATYAIGWLGCVLSSFFIGHFSLFGLTQVWNKMRGITPGKPVFRVPGPYKLVRHPMMLGVIMGLWALPSMTVGGLVLAAGFTLYIMIGTWFEERSLVEELGPDYQVYQRRVPKLNPLFRPGKKSPKLMTLL